MILENNKQYINNNNQLSKKINIKKYTKFNKLKKKQKYTLL